MLVNGIATGLCSAGLAAALLCAPLPAAAQMPGPDLFDVPAGCTAFLTVQARECTVSHHWTCEGDPEGTHWRISLDQDGPYYLSYTDAEFRWLRGWSLRSDSTTVLVEPEDDPASLTELLETGSDTMVFSLMVEGQTGRFRRDYTGFDSLTGGEVTVDGRTLLVTEFTYQYGVDGGARRVEGNQFVHEGWRMFFGGVETVTEPDGTSFEYNNSPMEFAEPGEPGFLTTRPIYDCGDMMSGLPRAPKSMVEQIFRVHAQGAVPGPNGGTDNDEL
ncbi:MAG: hypothetical protein N4A39_11795 [Roseicyclus sp.]|jgi:hypothetical protein|nr:hypothetical protein [Roseicyclus sp.]